MSKRRSMQTRIDSKKLKRRLRSRIKFVIILILLVFSGALGYGTYLYTKAESAMSGVYEEDEREKSDLRDEYVDQKFDNVTVLIMGIDQNEKREAREDARIDALIL